MSLFQAEKLIDLACSTTHQEEARTAALTACRLMMRLTLDPEREPAQRFRARPAAPEPVREKPPNGGSFARAPRYHIATRAAVETSLPVTRCTWFPVRLGVTMFVANT